ncbi:MAG: ferritin-like domain-containing protein [Anaerolineae bacterium]
MNKNESLTALSQALKLEQEGRAFYLQAAEKTRDERGKALFLSLADDERLHAEMIQRQLHAVEGDGLYVPLPDVDVEAVDAGQELFPLDPPAMDEKLGRDPDDLQAIFLALENEIASYDLYRQAAVATEDRAGKTMYLWLASAERTHFDLLMSNYESLVDRGSWV